jgi:hypothetical protein
MFGFVDNFSATGLFGRHVVVVVEPVLDPLSIEPALEPESVVPVFVEDEDVDVSVVVAPVDATSVVRFPLPLPRTVCVVVDVVPPALPFGAPAVVVGLPCVDTVVGFPVAGFDGLADCPFGAVGLAPPFAFGLIGFAASLSIGNATRAIAAKRLGMRADFRDIAVASA